MKPLHQIKKILIAIENSQYSDRVSSFGYDLAKQLNATVGLVHVNDIPVATPYAADPLISETPVMIPEVMSAQEETGKRLLENIAETSGIGVNTYLFNKIGNPYEGIVSTAEEFEADLLVLGTHGRTGFDHFISGSVAEKVVRNSKCPVLIIPNKDE